MLDPQSSQLGSTTDQQETKQNNNQDLHRAPTWAGCITYTGIIGTCNCLEVSVSHEDSATSHPHDQDYLSLWVGEGSEVELQQALSIYGG